LGAPLTIASVVAALTTGRSPGTRAAKRRREATSLRCSGPGAYVGHLTTSITFTVIVALFAVATVATVVSVAAAETVVAAAAETVVAVAAAKTVVAAAETIAATIVAAETIAATIVVAETSVPVATAETTVVAAETIAATIVAAETTVVAAETIVPVATAETTVVVAETSVPVATAKTTVIVAEAAVAGIAPEIFFVLPHSEGAAVRVAPGAVAVGAVAGAVAVAGTRLRPPSLILKVVDRARPVTPAGVFARLLPGHLAGGKDDEAKQGNRN